MTKYMGINYQFNKTSLQQLEKQLKVRVRALPTIKNKESALRLEVKKAKEDAARLELLLEKKIAGVKTPILEGVDFKIEKFSLFNHPQWFLDGIDLVKQLAQVGIEREFFHQKMILLEYARKKTTQKVNLFEKVQIPGYDEAILKIKRFMEDEENLSKSSQKIVKERQQQKEAEL